MSLKDAFRRRFIAAESDLLIIETIQTISKTKRQKLRLVKLKGTWHANKYNELVFEAAARRGSAKQPDKYTFKGSWKINENQQIQYACGDSPDVLTFKGHWDISSANRLVYKLEGSSTSRFEFKAQLESPTLYPKEGQIRYRIGIGARSKKYKQVIVLYGVWKLGRDLALNFNIDYGQGRIKSITFRAEVTFGRNEIVFELENERGEPLGITLTFSREFLKKRDAEAFLRLKAIGEEQGIETGVKIPF